MYVQYNSLLSIIIIIIDWRDLGRGSSGVRACEHFLLLGKNNDIFRKKIKKKIKIILKRLSLVNK